MRVCPVLVPYGSMRGGGGLMVHVGCVVIKQPARGLFGFERSRE